MSTLRISAVLSVQVCKARFNRRSTLWNHKRIHSDAKPFVCPVCQMTFKWKNSLKCHKEMHLRKNESGANIDNDRQLTYATAAKRKLVEWPKFLIKQCSKFAAGGRRWQHRHVEQRPDAAHGDHVDDDGAIKSLLLAQEALPS